MQEKSIYIKVHPTPEGEIIAMCDSELLGRKYSEGKVELDLSAYSNFYRGELVGEEEAGSAIALDGFYTANIVGERSVRIFIRKGIASESDVKRVEGIPYMHLFKMY